LEDRIADGVGTSPTFLVAGVRSSRAIERAAHQKGGTAGNYTPPWLLRRAGAVPSEIKFGVGLDRHGRREPVKVQPEQAARVVRARRSPAPQRSFGFEAA